ncbi:MULTISPECIES: hypothetical protein [Pseudoalteromonas]|nr:MULTISPECIES: hypothetical protein [Pseudoalteromonas]
MTKPVNIGKGFFDNRQVLKQANWLRSVITKVLFNHRTTQTEIPS